MTTAITQSCPGAASLIKAKFAGCACMGRTTAGPQWFIDGKQYHILLYHLPNTVDYYGAKYPDGACMVWPAGWMRARKILGLERVALKTKRVPIRSCRIPLRRQRVTLL